MRETHQIRAQFSAIRAAFRRSRRDWPSRTARSGPPYRVPRHAPRHSGLGLDSQLGHWVTDGLLAIFFFLAAIELKHELRHGELDTPRKALVPAVAAVGGVIVPALIFLLIVRDRRRSRSGWPIPTATDIAFALGVLAIVGKGAAPTVRALLLALAVIDDLIAILIIAVFFPASSQPVPFLIAVPVVLLFGWLSYRVTGRNRVVADPVMIAPRRRRVGARVPLGHPPDHRRCRAGPRAHRPRAAPARPSRHSSRGRTCVILPLFAFFAALVPHPRRDADAAESGVLGDLIALPVGKLIGITGGALHRALGWAGGQPTHAPRRPLAVAGLGGIGFTVSLLMNELAFEGTPDVSRPR